MSASREITVHDLNTLSIGYYIQAGIVGFYSLIMLLYFSFVGVLFGKMIGQSMENSGQSMPAGVGPIITVIFGVIFVMFAACTICLFMVGRWLREARHMLFIQIIAALSCLLIPYGTVLGVFTFIVLGRPDAKLLFSGNVPFNPSTISQQIKQDPMA